MRISEIERWEKLSEKWRLGSLNPEEKKELEEIRALLVEEAGRESSSAGFLVLCNWRWIFQSYSESVAISETERSDELEERIWWSSIAFVERWVRGNADSGLLSGDQNYYEALSEYLATTRLPNHLRSIPGWGKETVKGKWGMLRRELRSHVMDLLNGEDKSDVMSGSIEKRIEPLFNKLLIQVNQEVDSNCLTVDDKIKLMNKMSSLLAEMKGEKKPNGDRIEVTNNNVFLQILNRSEGQQALMDMTSAKAKAKVILESGDYKLV